MTTASITAATSMLESSTLRGVEDNWPSLNTSLVPPNGTLTNQPLASDTILSLNHTTPFTSRKLLLPDLVFEGTWLACIILVGTVGNMVVLAYNVFTKKRERLMPIEVLILNSALADFCSCLSCVAMQMYGTLNRSWDLGDSACTATFLLSCQTMCVSINSNFGISIFCLFTCILFPNTKVQLKHAFYICVAIWLYVAALLHFPLFATGVHVRFDDQVLFFCWVGFDREFMDYLLISLLPTGYLPAILLAGVYLVIVIKMSRSRAWENKEHTKKLVRSTVGIVALFFSCFFPSFIFMFMNHKSFTDWPARIMRYSQYIMISNTALNPIYYTYRMDDMVPKSLVNIVSGTMVRTSGQASGSGGNTPAPAAAGAALPLAVISITCITPDIMVVHSQTL